jgi:ParB-like chromosome segregation protein Spo0J
MSKAFDLIEIDVKRLEPNPWNPNRMSPEMYEKLREYVKKEGLVSPSS